MFSYLIPFVGREEEVGGEGPLGGVGVLDGFAGRLGVLLNRPVNLETKCEVRLG
jgi:hypothetical protein